MTELDQLRADNAKLREELAEAKRVTFDPAVLEKMNLLEKQLDALALALEKCAMFKLQPDSIQMIVNNALAIVKELK